MAATLRRIITKQNAADFRRLINERTAPGNPGGSGKVEHAYTCPTFPASSRLWCSVSQYDTHVRWVGVGETIRIRGRISVARARSRCDQNQTSLHWVTPGNVGHAGIGCE